MQSVTRLHAVSVSTVLLVVLIAGCLSGVGGSQPSTATDSPEPIKAGSETPCAISLAFYGPLVESEYSQPPDEVSIGFAIQGGAHVMFVAEENETILGTSFTAAEHNSVADGHTVSFDEPLNGTHTVQVSAYEDTNHNKQFDRGIDRPCYNDGEHVQTKSKIFNFSSG